MKIKLIPAFSVLTVLALTLFAVSPVRAQITAINATSVSTNIFSDNSSLNPSSAAGSEYDAFVAPWNGSAVNINLTTDPTTLDSASSSVSAGYSGSSYSVSLNNISLTQASGNTGHADLINFFEVYYQLGGGALPSQATMFPTLLVSGSVQNVAGSYASVTGYINYYDIHLNVPTLLDTVNYSYLNNTLGSTFNNITVGTTVNNGTTPLLPSGDTLELVGYFHFEVDPASLTVETVPEPSSGALMGLAAVCGLVWRRLARQ